LEEKGIPLKEAQEKAKVILATVGIDESKHKRYPANLSGGEQQRVAIARAMSTGAKVIIADEPTGNLDAENGEAIVALLRRLTQSENYCVVIVTHNREFAELSDTMFQMSNGAISVSST